MDVQETIEHPASWAATADSAGRYRQRSGGGRNTQAQVAMATGIVALLTSVLVVGGVLGVPGLVLGTCALRTAGRTGAGRRRAVTAIATSAMAITLSVTVVLGAVWFADKTQDCYQFNKIRQWTQCVDEHIDLG